MMQQLVCCLQARKAARRLSKEQTSVTDAC